jgi:hypothetical protein
VELRFSGICGIASVNSNYWLCVDYAASQS